MLKIYSQYMIIFNFFSKDKIMAMEENNIILLRICTFSKCHKSLVIPRNMLNNF